MRFCCCCCGIRWCCIAVDASFGRVFATAMMTVAVRSRCYCTSAVVAGLLGVMVAAAACVSVFAC